MRYTSVILNKIDVPRSEAKGPLDVAMTSGIVNRRDGCEELRSGDSLVHEDHACCSARDNMSSSTSPRAGFVHGVLKGSESESIKDSLAGHVHIGASLQEKD
ncbi:hypothetical protein VNO77_33846 [Canavalia gladiata]|uniref:Uncharacterized protein n=1 Tax=Canavalia gladiata TaxID=3824 RepID=A0AAN9PY28_CANGL